MAQPGTTAMTARRNASTSTSQMAGDEPYPASVLDQVMQRHLLLDDAVIELADAGAQRSIARLVARRLDLRTDAVVGALDAPSEEPMIVLCRAAGLSINVFSAVLPMPRRTRRRRRSTDCSPAQAL